MDIIRNRSEYLAWVNANYPYASLSDIREYKPKSYPAIFAEGYTNIDFSYERAIPVWIYPSDAMAMVKAFDNAKKGGVS